VGHRPDFRYLTVPENKQRGGVNSPVERLKQTKLRFNINTVWTGLPKMVIS
jgi:hypothetical protein